jgi:hypothetical protein
MREEPMSDFQAIAEMVGREQIRTEGERLQSQWDFFVQTTHPGTIQLDGDTATERVYEIRYLDTSPLAGSAPPAARAPADPPAGDKDAAQRQR